MKFAIALEQDEAPRLRLAEKLLFLSAQLMAVAAENDRTHRHVICSLKTRGRPVTRLKSLRGDDASLAVGLERFAHIRRRGLVRKTADPQPVPGSLAWYFGPFERR